MAQRHFHGHETARVDSLEGVPLATSWQRVLGYVVDLFVAVVVWGSVLVSWKVFVLHQHKIEGLDWDFHHLSNIVVMLLYWGSCNYLWNGRTVGKWVARTRAVSLTSERMGLWQSLERALGYGAAILEGSLGFWQYFWDKNRQCAQDRLAETIVVDTRKRKV